MENINYHIGSGERILFWKDWWVGDKALAVQFPDLFNCVVDKNANVNSYMLRNGDRMVWSPTLRRNLKDHEVPELISLLNILNGVHIPEGGEDYRVWSASKDGLFSVTSFFSAIHNKPMERNAICRI